MDPKVKEEVKATCLKEMNSWKEAPKQEEGGKIAVMYLYNNLDGKTLYKEDLPTAFDDFKKNKTETAGTGTEGKDAKSGEILKD
jgi:hypothetical protein